MDELQELLLEENSELSRGDAHDLAWERVARADECVRAGVAFPDGLSEALGKRRAA